MSESDRRGDRHDTNEPHTPVDRTPVWSAPNSAGLVVPVLFCEPSPGLIAPSNLAVPINLLDLNLFTPGYGLPTKQLPFGPFGNPMVFNPFTSAYGLPISRLPFGPAVRQGETPIL